MANTKTGGDKDRQTDIWTSKQKDKWTDRQRKTDRQTKNREKNFKTCRQTETS